MTPVELIADTAVKALRALLEMCDDSVEVMVHTQGEMDAEPELIVFVVRGEPRIPIYDFVQELKYKREKAAGIVHPAVEELEKIYNTKMQPRPPAKKKSKRGAE